MNLNQGFSLTEPVYETNLFRKTLQPFIQNYYGNSNEKSISYHKEYP